MGAMVPNSFPHPNIQVDKLHYFLTSEEKDVLTKATREILGWHNRIEERKAPISLSVFHDGKRDAEGNRLCYGCGLSINAIRRALDSLDQFRILVKVGEPTQDGQMYWLQDDENKIDWEALEARREEWDEKNRKRVKAATKSATRKKRNKNNGTEALSSDDRPEEGVSSDDREGYRPTIEGVSSDDNKEIQIETQKETQNNVDSGAVDGSPSAADNNNMESGKGSEEKVEKAGCRECGAKVPDTAPDDRCPYCLLRAGWQYYFPGKPQPQVSTTKWRNQANTRWKDRAFREGWVAMLEKASTSPTLREEQWFNFDYWTRNEINWTKVRDGVFDFKDEQRTRQRQQQARQQQAAGGALGFRPG